MSSLSCCLFVSFFAVSAVAFVQQQQQQQQQQHNAKGDQVVLSALQEKGAGSGTGTGHQTPEELGFTSDGDLPADSSSAASQFSEDHCLDLGAKGFPLPVFDMLQEANWNPAAYFEQLQSKGYAEDALQMTGPRDAMLKTDCMKENFRGRTKHIFVGDSQMMTLRNAFHRHNRCPEIWWVNRSEDHAAIKSLRQKLGGRLHSSTEQSPQEMLPKGCTEEGIASFVYWDAWAEPAIPVEAIKSEMQKVGLDPKQGDNVVVWVGSNYIGARRRMGVLLDTIDRLHALGVKMVWDSPTFVDAVLMAATSTHDAGRDPNNEIPIAFTAIGQRKARGELGSNEYTTEKDLAARGVDIPVTKRWQLTNRYRGLQCDGIHTDMRGRDPLFYSTPCPAGQQEYGRSVFCNWVEPFRHELAASCPQGSGVDDLVLQSGLFALCAAREKPFCFQHTAAIR